MPNSDFFGKIGYSTGFWIHQLLKSNLGARSTQRPISNKPHKTGRRKTHSAFFRLDLAPSASLAETNRSPATPTSRTTRVFTVPLASATASIIPQHTDRQQCRHHPKNHQSMTQPSRSARSMSHQTRHHLRVDRLDDLPVLPLGVNRWWG